MRKLVVGITLLLIVTACDPGKGSFIDRCKRHVETQLRSPGSATYGSLADAVIDTDGPFPNLDRDGYEEISGNRFWFAYVDSNNAFGTPIRSYISCSELVDGEFDFVVSPTPPFN